MRRFIISALTSFLFVMPLATDTVFAECHAKLNCVGKGFGHDGDAPHDTVWKQAEWAISQVLGNNRFSVGKGYRSYRPRIVR